MKTEHDDESSVEPHTNYDEEAFNALVEQDDGSSSEDDVELSDFPEGADESDGKTDTNSNEQPEGDQDSNDDKKTDTKADADNKAAEGDDDPDSDKDEGPDLPDWIDLLPEDKRDAAVTDFLKLQEDIEKVNARYASQSGQLKPTQRRLAKLETVIKKFSEALKPGDDIDKRGEALDAWIEKHGEDFPDEAADLKATLDAYRDAVSPVVDPAGEVRSTIRDVEVNEDVDQTVQQRLLTRMDDSAAQISLDPSFKAYLQEHPEHLAQAQSPFAHDVIEVIDQFRKDTDWEPPTTSEGFATVNQMLVSPIFEGWSKAIGLTGKQIVGMGPVDQIKVLDSFKADLDAANANDAGSDNNEDDDDNPGPGEESEAERLARKRRNRKRDKSPAARGTKTGGGNVTALKGKAYFDSLELD